MGATVGEAAWGEVGATEVEAACGEVGATPGGFHI